MLAEITVQTGTRSELVDITPHIQDVIDDSNLTDGLCHIFVPHTTAGLTLNENWDPAVRTDVMRTLERLVPWQGDYRHAEGNSAAHIRASLLGASVWIPLQQGELVLGSWQGIFLAEFDGPRRRRVLIKLLEG